MTDERQRRTFIIHPEYFVWPILLALAWWFLWWMFVVPPDSTRAILCPKHERRAETYRTLADIRPLKDYELKGWAASDEYVKRWCQ